MIFSVKDGDPSADSEPGSSEYGKDVSQKVKSDFENDMKNAAEDLQEFDPADFAQSAIALNLGKTLLLNSIMILKEMWGNLMNLNKFPLYESEMSADDYLDTKYEKNESAKCKRNKEKRIVYRNKQKQLSKKKATFNQKYEDENDIISSSKEEKDDDDLKNKTTYYRVGLMPK